MWVQLNWDLTFQPKYWSSLKMYIYIAMNRVIILKHVCQIRKSLVYFQSFYRSRLNQRLQSISILISIYKPHFLPVLLVSVRFNRSKFWSSQLFLEIIGSSLSYSYFILAYSTWYQTRLCIYISIIPLLSFSILLFDSPIIWDIKIVEVKREENKNT